MHKGTEQVPFSLIKLFACKFDCGKIRGQIPYPNYKKIREKYHSQDWTKYAQNDTILKEVI